METINILEKLKGCPVGTKLYSPAFGEIELLQLSLNYAHGLNGIMCKTALGDTRGFDENGTIYDGGECMLFPSRDQRDWSKFNPVFPPFDVKRKNETRFYYIDTCCEVQFFTECLADATEFQFESGNYFNTRAQAEYAAQKVKELLLSMRKEAR